MDDGLARDQLRLALASLAPNLYVMPVFAAILGVLFSRWVALPALVGWGCLVAVGVVPLGVVSARYLKMAPAAGDTRIWVRRATLAHLICASSWASMGFFLWVPGSDFDHVLLLLVLACTLAGNMALTGASRALTINGYAAHGGMLILVPLRGGGEDGTIVALLAALFVGYMIYMSTQIYGTSRRMLTLANEKSVLLDEKTALIAELWQSKAEADRANQAKSQFLARMSHELRTPLNAVIGFSEMIGSGMAPGRIDEYADIIGRSGHHLLGLINDILDLSKIEAGRFTLRESIVDLRALIADCAASLRVKADAGGLALALETGEDVPDVFADERCVRQIVLNLISNAVKFTRPGGTIAVGALVSRGSEICVRVRDTGVGIAEADLARVFESFGQGQHDVVNQDQGTGLGLPIVKGLAEAHGGRVTLESEVNRGTCVSVFLPASRARYRRQDRAMIA